MSGRPAAVLCAAAIAAVLVACSTTPPPPSGLTTSASPTPGVSTAPSGLGATFDPAMTPPPIAFDGLYVGDDVSVTGDATVAVIRSAMACPALEHLIGAGEWVIASRDVQSTGSATDPRTTTILTLQDGAETALALLAGGDTCTARIARTTPGTLKLAGAATFDGQAAMDQPLCITSGRSVAFGVTFRTPSGPDVQVSLVAPARLGMARLVSDDVTVHLTRGAMSLQQLAAILSAGFHDSKKGYFAEEYVPNEDSKARLEVESINPFVGTLHLSGFQGASGTIDLDGTVACHLPGGALQRLFDETAAATPSVPPGPVGPTVAPVQGAAPGTLVATGGLVAGTYPLPASALDCYYDFDAGAWMISTASTADPNFYVYAFLGQGGGATDTASLGLIRGDGSNGRIALFDTTVSPAVGAAHAQVSVSGQQVTIAVQARNPDGVTLAANLSCTAS